MLLPITIQVPDELADRLSTRTDELPQILELGLREIEAADELSFTGAADVLEFLANLPSPEEVLDLRPSEVLQERISELLEKNRTFGLSGEEEAEWEQFQYLEHLVRLAKAKAYLRLNE
jgi:hypothetical protein